MVSTLPRSTFNYNSFECSFRRKAAASGFESQPPLLLIHPVGIGLASWFWDQFLDEWNGGEVYVPDLIGCGDSEEWDPSEQGLFVPLDWVRQLETLWVAEIRRPMVVMSQGGLAPLAIQLASPKYGATIARRASLKSTYRSFSMRTISRRTISAAAGSSPSAKAGDWLGSGVRG